MATLTPSDAFHFSEVIRTNSASRSLSGQGAPPAIHSSTKAICSLLSRSFSLGGISMPSHLIACSSGLSPGFPGTRDGSSLSPPRNRPSRVSMLNSPRISSLSSPWQAKHFSRKIGRTRFANTSSTRENADRLESSAALAGRKQATTNRMPDAEVRTGRSIGTLEAEEWIRLDRPQE